MQLGNAFVTCQSRRTSWSEAVRDARPGGEPLWCARKEPRAFLLARGEAKLWVKQAAPANYPAPIPPGRSVSVFDRTGLIERTERWVIPGSRLLSKLSGLTND
jgi:hypothetical protein